jgi:hypothetical protein
MRKILLSLVLFSALAINPPIILGGSNQFQQAQKFSNFSVQQKGSNLYFQITNNNTHIFVDVYTLTGKRLFRVLDKIFSQGNYSFNPFARSNLSRQTYIFRLSDGVRNEFFRIINIGNNSASTLQSIHNHSAKSAKVDVGNRDVIKTYTSKEIGDGVILDKIFNLDSSNGVFRGFMINVQNDDNYYISSWIQGQAGSSKDVFIDGQATASGRAILKSNGWQTSTIISNSTPASPISVHLSRGDHTIAFRGKGPGVPDVEFLRLGRTVNDAFISNTAYQKKLAGIKAYAASHPVQPVTENSKYAPGFAKVAVDTPEPSDPKYDYDGCTDQPFSYTHRGEFYLNQNDQVKFEVRNGTTNCVMYLFNAWDLTQSTSWFGYNDIEVTIPEYGKYILLVRAYYSGDAGTADLYLNNTLYQSGIILAGNYYLAYRTKTGVLNYFTCDPPNSPYNTDTYIFVTNYRMYTPIAAFNDDYYGSGDFTWGLWSRCKVDLSSWDSYDWACIIGSSYSSYGDGNCDFYLCNEPATYDTVKYYNLEKDDAIKSAPVDTNYNCFSWSGGRTDFGGGFTPCDPTCRWFDSDNMCRKSWDNFYGNTPVHRYDGAMTYDTTDDTALAEIDLWTSMMVWTHASVRKPGDNFYHGYDWESKLGTDQRIFHPRLALDIPYGYPTAHYKHSGAKSKSTSKGNRLAEPISFSDGDMINIGDLSNMVDGKSKVAFDSLYALWKKTWSSPDLQIQSNPEMFFFSKEYSFFAAFCISKGKAIIPLCMKKYLEGDFLAGYAIYKSGLIANDYKIMEAVRANSEQGKISADGYFIIERQGNGWIRYFKILLDQEL